MESSMKYKADKLCENMLGGGTGDIERQRWWRNFMYEDRLESLLRFDRFLSRNVVEVFTDFVLQFIIQICTNPSKVLAKTLKTVVWRNTYSNVTGKLYLVCIIQ
jgi:hypothetical protein